MAALFQKPNPGAASKGPGPPSASGTMGEAARGEERDTVTPERAAQAAELC